VQQVIVRLHEVLLLALGMARRSVLDWRKLDMALDAVLFTVPTEQPRTPAVASSDRSSK
jgi:hypothetical protein